MLIQIQSRFLNIWPLESEKNTFSDFPAGNLIVQDTCVPGVFSKRTLTKKVYLSPGSLWNCLFCAKDKNRAYFSFIWHNGWVLIGTDNYQWHFYDNKWAKELFNVEILYDILKSRIERISPVTFLNMQIRLYFIPSMGGIRSIFIN